MIQTHHNIFLGKCLAKQPVKYIEKYQVHTILSRLKPVDNCRKIVASVSSRARKKTTKLSMLRLG